MEIFSEVKRVLKKTGTIWVVLGDSYAGAGQGPQGRTDTGNHTRRQGYVRGIDKQHLAGIKPKDLVGIPWRVAFALQADGWWLRQDIIWAKPNPMPESVKDRCTKSHEYIFLLTKSKKYWYDYTAILIPYTTPMNRWGGQVLKADGKSEWDEGTGQATYRNRDMRPNPKGKNRRDVWWVSVKSSGYKHFSSYPPDLIEPCIPAGCPQWVCKKCGKPRERVIKNIPMIIKRSERGRHLGKYGKAASSRTMLKPAKSKTVGWSDCSCSASFTPGIVLDPFIGSGTTAIAALQTGRDYIGIDISKKYCKMARSRIIQHRNNKKRNSKKVESSIEL